MTSHNPSRSQIIAAPEAESVLRALGLGTERAGRWLHAETRDPATARAALRPLPLDWSVRAVDAPPPRLFVSDMDSSVIAQECIDELADFAGRRAEVAAITDRAMAGELDFRDALIARVSLLAGLDTTAMERCRLERVRLRPGAARLTTALRRAGAYTALVSGGFEEFVRPVADEAGFDVWRANRLVLEDGVLTGSVAEPVLDAAAKARFLAELAAAQHAAPKETVAMGDGANDLPLLREAGFAIVVGGKDVALAEADAAVRSGDLSVVAAFLGLTEL